MGKIISILTWLPRFLIVRPIKGCLRKGFGCLFLFLLVSALMIGLLWFAIGEAQGQEPASDPLAVYLLIDNSNSMWEKGGIGSDPQLLRIDAARLFISYLGVDESRLTHQCAVIFFGSEAQTVAPLTPLNSQAQREQMLGTIGNPQRMGWSDHAAALDLALAGVSTFEPGVQPAVVLLTDGRPEWDYDLSQSDREQYIARLQEQGAALAEAGIPLFIILLANDATDADPEIARLWQPVWREMTAATAPGRFYVAREAADLTSIYHDIVVALTHQNTAGPVLQAEVEAGGLRRTVNVEPNLARLTLVVSKSQPELQVSILLPGGEKLDANGPNVRYAGQAGVTREEIWVVEEPMPGDWTVLVSGEGRLTVWKDYRLAPTPVPTFTPTMAPTQTATPTPAPSATATSSATATAVPTATAMRPGKVAAAEVGSGKVRRSGSFWPWILGGMVALSATGMVTFRHKQGQSPIVEGELVLVQGPGFAEGTAKIELDLLGQRKVVVGAPPADLVLRQATEQFTLSPGAPVEDSRPVVISGPPDVLVNDQPLEGAINTLQDMDIITIGETVLRYEHLRLRGAIRSRLSIER